MEILHDLEKSEFRLVQDPRAILSYHREGSVLDFSHVYVPMALRGKGIADLLATHAFEYALQKGFQVTPSCPFISGSFLRRFPQYQKTLSHSA